MKGAHRDVWGIGKTFWCLQVFFLKSKSVQAKNFQKVRQTYLFITTRLDTWTLNDWNLGLWKTERLDSRLLDSGRLYAWTLDS